MFHFFVVFVGLYLVFIYVIRKDIEKGTNYFFGSVLNRTIINDLIEKGYDDLDDPQKKLIYDKL